MRALHAKRSQQQAHAQRALGLPGQMERLFASQVAALRHEAELQRLPVDSSGYAPLQDPVTGEPYFMFGYDAFMDDAAQAPFAG